MLFKVGDRVRPLVTQYSDWTRAGRIEHNVGVVVYARHHTLKINWINGFTYFDWHNNTELEGMVNGLTPSPPGSLARYDLIRTPFQYAETGLDRMLELVP